MVGTRSQDAGKEMINCGQVTDHWRPSVHILGMA